MPKSHHSATKWFYQVRGSYLPCSWQGRLIYLIYVIYLLAVLAAWYRLEHSLWTLLVQTIPVMIGAAILTQLIASKHSK